jgi:hypothetical protein
MQFWRWSVGKYQLGRPEGGGGRIILLWILRDGLRGWEVEKVAYYVYNVWVWY